MFSALSNPHSFEMHRLDLMSDEDREGQHSLKQSKISCK
jgi:hypothetical protein